MSVAYGMERATQFLNSARLRNELFKKLNTPGSIIRLESPIHVVGGQVDVIYNHPNYIRMRTIRKKWECEPVQKGYSSRRRLHVAGSPGIGTSNYLVIEMLYTLIERYHEPGFNVIFVAGKEEMYSYVPRFGWTRHCDWNELRRTSEINEVYRNNTCQFIDSLVEPEGRNGRTLWVSPIHGKYCRTFDEASGQNLLLPAWTLEELLDAYSKLKDEPSFQCVLDDPRNVTEESIRREFGIWGGIPRILFHSDIWCDYSVSALLRDIRELTDDTLQDLQNEGDSLLRHRLFHYSIDPGTFQKYGMQYASPLIQVLVQLSDASGTVEGLQKFVRESLDQKAFAFLFLKLLCPRLQRPRLWRWQTNEVEFDPAVLYVADFAAVRATAKTNGRAIHQVALTNARVLTLPLDGDVRLCSSKASLFTEDYINSKSNIVSNASIFGNLFPGIDAMMSLPFVFFRFCDQSTCSSNTENELFNSLYMLLEKFQVVPKTNGACRSSPSPRINFFFTFPDKGLCETFTLVNEPVIARYLAAPACSCSRTNERRLRARSWEISVPRSSELSGVRSSAMDVDDPVSANVNGQQTTLSRSHPTLVCSEPDTPCSYCKCLQYFNFHALGIPVFYTYQTAKKAIGFVDDVFALDVQGNIVVQKWARVA